MAYGLVRIIVWYLRVHATTLTITSRRSILRSGVFTTTSLELPHQEVEEVLVRQRLWDRLVNVGDITIIGSKETGPTLNLLGIPDAENVAHQIRSRRQAA
jgi:uncharacterized membrane protein YdbT with pleckstrin-like domain